MLLSQSLHQLLLQVAAGEGVEGGEGLVEQENLWIEREGAGEGGADRLEAQWRQRAQVPHVEVLVVFV